MLGEVEMQPRRLHMTHQLMLLDPLVVADGGDHMPVAKVKVAIGDRQRPRPSRCTTPPRTAYTGVPFGAEMSIPKWNARDFPEMRGSLK